MRGAELDAYEISLLPRTDFYIVMYAIDNVASFQHAVHLARTMRYEKVCSLIISILLASAARRG